MLLGIDYCPKKRVDAEKNIVPAINYAQKWSLSVTGWLPFAPSTGVIAKYYLSKQQCDWGCQWLCQEECLENWMGCYMRERLQWPLASHKRVWEGGARKMRRQKMSISPTDTGIKGLPFVFVTVLLKLQNVSRMGKKMCLHKLCLGLSLMPVSHTEGQIHPVNN